MATKSKVKTVTVDLLPYPEVEFNNWAAELSGGKWFIANRGEKRTDMLGGFIAKMTPEHENMGTDLVALKVALNTVRTMAGSKRMLFMLIDLYNTPYALTAEGRAEVFTLLQGLGLVGLHPREVKP
jgi:hypothetical protein